MTALALRTARSVYYHVTLKITSIRTYTQQVQRRVGSVTLLLTQSGVLHLGNLIYGPMYLPLLLGLHGVMLDVDRFEAPLGSGGRLVVLSGCPFKLGMGLSISVTA